MRCKMCGQQRDRFRQYRGRGRAALDASQQLTCYPATTPLPCLTPSGCICALHSSSHHCCRAPAHSIHHQGHVATTVGPYSSDSRLSLVSAFKLCTCPALINTLSTLDRQGCLHRTGSTASTMRPNLQYCSTQNLAMECAQPVSRSRTE